MFNEFKKLLKHSIIYGAGTLISKAVGFLMIPVYTRYLSPKDYGIIEILTLSSSIISGFLSMGLSYSILRFYFDYDTEKDKKQVVSTGLISLILVTILGLTVLFIFTNRLSLILFKSLDYTFYFKLVFLTTFFELTLGIPMTYLRAKERSFLFTVISLSQLIVGLSLNIYLIAILKIGILGVFYSSLISNSFICIVMLVIIFKQIGFSFSVDKFKKLLNYGIPLIPIGLAHFILTYSDRYFLKYFSSLDIVGIYSLGYRFAMMLGVLIITPFQQVWNVSMFTIAKKDNAKQIYSRVLTYFAFIIIFAGLGLSVFSKEIMKIVATPAYFDAYKVIPIVVLAYIFSGINTIVCIGIFLKKKTKYFAHMAVSTALFNLLFNWLLIPKYKMMGAGVATMLSYLYLAICTNFFSQKSYSISFEFKRISKILLVAIFLYMCSLLINTDSFLNSILFKGLIFLSFPVLLYFLHFYEKNELYKFRELIILYFTKIRTAINQNVAKVWALNNKI